MDQWPPIEGNDTSLAGVFVILAFFFVIGMLVFIATSGEVDADSGRVDYHQSA